MMSTLRNLTFALAAVLMLGGTVPPATAAQTSPEELLTQLDGLQTAYARKYIAGRDLSFTTPVVSDTSTPSTMLVTVLEFETDADVSTAYATALNGLIVRALLGESDIELEETQIDRLGDPAVLDTGVVETSDGPGHQSLLAVQDANLGILIDASGLYGSTNVVLANIARFMVEAELGHEQVTVSEYRASGGTFEIKPAMAEADLLRGLVPM